MRFTSYEFPGFAAFVLFGYYLLPKKAKWPWLLVASLVFYILSGPVWVLCIVVTALSVYGTALYTDRSLTNQKALLKAKSGELTKEEKDNLKARGEKKRRVLLVLCIVLNVAILVLFKATPLFPVQALGISYYTLRSIGYLVDVNRGVYPAEKNPGKLLLYVTFFPLILQGPLTDYSKLAPSLFAGKRFDKNNFCRGLLRVTWGFFKKLVIADRAYVGVSAIVASEPEFTGGWVLVGMILYALELYADFSGGIDIAIGVSDMLGITVQENFDRPFFSKSLKEYWRRWHMTMSAWFKTYLFYPISVSGPMKKLLRFTRAKFGEKAGKRIPVYIASFLVWFITGIWHGFGLSFVVWALMHFAILMISEELEPLYARFHARFKFSNTKGWSIFMNFRTLFIVSALMQFDIFRDVPLAFSRFFDMFSGNGWGEIFTAKFWTLGLTISDVAILAAGALILFLADYFKGDGKFGNKLAKKNAFLRYGAFLFLLVSVLLFGKYGFGYDPGEFIYTRF